MHGAAGFFGLTANHQVSFLIDEQRQALAHDGMIVHHQDSALSRCCAVLNLVSEVHISQSSTGNKQVTVVPRTLPRCTASEAPIILAR